MGIPSSQMPLPGSQDAPPRYITTTTVAIIAIIALAVSVLWYADMHYKNAGTPTSTGPAASASP